MPTWEQRGRLRYHRDADILFLEIHDVFSLEDAEKMYELSDAMQAQYGYVLTVFDASDAKGMSPAARRLVAERARQYGVHGAAAIIGASLVVRTLVQLMRNAVRLFGGSQAPMQFCSTAEEAVKWLAVQRIELRPVEPSSR